MRHTAGPWRSRKHSILASNGSMVGTVSAKVSDAETFANSHLLAAAPDLLALAIDLLLSAELSQDNLEPETVSLISRAQNIINQARG